MANDFDPYHRWLGIPPEEQPPDHYRLLGVARFETDPEVISNASDQRMSHLRTFASGKRGPDSQRLLNEIALATRSLLDETRKQKYDAELRAKLAPRQPVAAAAPQQPVYYPVQPLPVAPLPMPRPIPVQSPVPMATATSPTHAQPEAASSAKPIVATRRPVRRKSDSSLAVAAIALLLVGGIAIAGYLAYANRQDLPPIGEKPVDPAEIAKKREKAKPKPAIPPTVPVETKPATDERVAWFSPDGEDRAAFERVDAKRWKKTASESKVLNFVEKTDQYIALYDPALKLAIRLYDDHLEHSADRKTWEQGGSGSWVRAAEIASLLKAPQKPIVPSGEPLKVAKLVFDGKGKAKLSGAMSLLDIEEPFTLEFWFRRTGDLDTTLGLLRLGQLSVTLGVKNSPEDPAYWSELFAGTWSRKPQNAPPDVQWHHFALVGDGSQITTYLDGRPYHEATLKKLAVRELEPIELGIADSQTGEHSFEGELHSLQLSQTARYRDGQAFTPPKPHETELVGGAMLTFDGVQENKPGVKPPLVVDVPRPKPETPETIQRKPLPSDDDLKAAQPGIATVYGERLKLAMKPEEKQKLAAELRTAASTEPSDPTGYALLLEARKLAVATHDVALGVEIVGDVSSRFEVDRLDLLAKFLSDLAPRSLAQPQRDQLVLEALAGASAALRADDWPAADELSTVATSNAAKGKDPDQKKVARQLRDHVVALKPSWEAKREALKKLADSPDDPAAHLAVGRYYALATGDFAKASEHLAKASDPALSEAGRKQLAANDDESRFAAAEAWHALISGLKAAERIEVQRHVLAIAQETVSQLAGVKKSQAEMFIKELQPLVAEAEKGLGPSKPAKLTPGLVARLYAGASRATPYLAVARDEQDLAQLNFRAFDLIEEYSPGIGVSPRFTLLGAVVVEKDMEVKFDLQGCSCTIGPRTMQGTPRMPVDLTVPMTKGVYPVMITTTSSSFQFRIVGVDSLNSLLFHDDRLLQAEMEKIVPVPKGGSSKGRRID